MLDRIQRHLGALIGDRSPLGGPDRLREAESYAERILQAAGLRVTREPIAVAGGAWCNVFGDLGPEGGAPLFVVGAHLDTVRGTPGADDNASGAAALLALAEWAGSRPSPRSHTLRFAAFNLEEWGMAGSLEHAEALRRAGRPVEGMISLEMIGYVDSAPGAQRFPPGMGFGRRRTGDFISVVGNGASRALTAGLARSLGAAGLPVEAASLPASLAMLVGASLSDHSSFWRQGYRAAMVGDTTFYRNPHYHLPTDTLETLSLPFIESVTQGVAGFLELLEGADR
ncbi:MAG: M28 family peptidase [Acidobacteria bacterium]|nr:M28 family peptidase [Acidobacteriota bacterium]